jgi:putative transposase
LTPNPLNFYYSTNAGEIKKITRGPQQGNEERKLAMYLCQELTCVKLREIADYFNLHHGGSVSFINHQIRKLKREDKLLQRNVGG